MSKFVAVLCCAIAAGCASDAGKITLRREKSDAAYLDKHALESVILGVQTLRYPLTRAETLATLQLTDRGLPSLTTLEGEPVTFTNHRETIHLTDAEKKGRRYALLLWYDPSARSLSGDAFVRAKVVNYVEILVEDDGTGDSPAGKYILQSSRYPYVRLDYPGRLPATP